MPEMNDPCANSRLAAIMRGVGPGAKLSKGWRAEFTDAMNCCVVCCWEARGRTRGGERTGAKLSKGWRAEFTDAMNCCVVCCWEARGRTPTTSAKTKGIVFRKGCRSDRDFMRSFCKPPFI